MRCAHCGRRLTNPAFVAPASAGGWMLGPVCLSRPGDLSREIRAVLMDLELLKRAHGKGWQVTAPKKRKRGANVPACRARALPGQLDFFDGDENKLPDS